MIYIRTTAYNAAETLPRAIESVRKQTYQEFKYYICDNGSTDRGKTRKIIEDYAALDKRIIPSFNQKNKVWDDNLDFLYLPRNIGDDDCFCVLDADDAYKPLFCEKMIAFLDQYHLDIVACGNDFINAATNQLCSVRNIKYDLILEDKGLGLYFPIYYQFMRTVWGKLFRGKAAYHVTIDRADPNLPFLVYGGDTYGVMNAFQDAQRVGILSESLHKYYMSTKSTSYIWNKKRIKADQILHHKAIHYLMDKVGIVSTENEEFLLVVHFNAIKDTLNVLLNAKISFDERLAGFYDIFTSMETRKLVDYQFSNYPQINKEREILLQQIADWILSRKSAREINYLERIGRIFAAMHISPAKINGWSDAQIFTLLVKIREHSESETFNAQIDDKIVILTAKQPLLAGLTIGFFLFFHEITIAVLNENYIDAIGEINVCLEKKEIPDVWELPLVFLGLNLSAKLEDMESFVFFKKLQILFLLERGQHETALKELDDWDQLMPDDNDFKEFRSRMI